MDTKHCGKCEKPMAPSISRSRPECSEWRCAKCRISKAMGIDEVNYFIATRKGGQNVSSVR